MFYLRPGNLYKEFVIQQRKAGEISAIGRVRSVHEEQGKTTLFGILSDADEKTQKRFKQLEYNVTHTIVQKGSENAEIKAKLSLGKRMFEVKSVDNVSDLGLYTIYYVEERKDINE